MTADLNRGDTELAAAVAMAAGTEQVVAAYEDYYLADLEIFYQGRYVTVAVTVYGNWNDWIFTDAAERTTTTED